MNSRGSGPPVSPSGSAHGSDNTDTQADMSLKCVVHLQQSLILCRCGPDVSSFTDISNYLLKASVRFRPEAVFFQNTLKIPYSFIITLVSSLAKFYRFYMQSSQSHTCNTTHDILISPTIHLLTLVPLNLDISFFENIVDPDQLASDDAI